MDFKERLLRNDIRHLTENLREVSEELIVLQEFVQHAFSSQFQTFLRTRDGTKSSGFTSMNARSNKRQMPQHATTGSSIPKMSKIEAVTNSSKQRKRTRTSQKQVELLNVATKGEKEDFEHSEASEPEAEPEFEDGTEEIEVFAVFPDIETGGYVDNSNSGDEGKAVLPNNDFEKENYQINKTGDDANNDGVSDVGGGSDDDFTVSKSDEEYKEDEGDKSDPDFDLPSSSKKKGRKRLIKREYNDKYESRRRAKARPCPICGEIFDWRKLRNHMSDHTEDEAVEKLVCQICCCTYPNEESYTRHMEKGHEKKKRNGKVSKKCQYCERTFPNITVKERHEVTHTGERNFDCEICDATFTRSDSRSRHMRNFHHT